MSPLPPRDPQLSENTAPVSQADAFDAQTAKAGIRRFAALWPLMPPVALFGIAFAFIGSPLPTPIGSRTSAASTSVISASNWVVPASETMVVVKQAASGYALLRGRLRSPQGELVAAPTRGQVARVMARIGQVVRTGDPLLLISRGTIDAPRSTSPLERWQTQAEDAQIAAARQQETLEGRMSGAHERLQNAQARVAAAQARVADARALIKRLQNGEEVSRNEVNSAAEAAQPEPTATERQPERSPQNEKSALMARADAIRENQQLQKTADAADARAKIANRAAQKADGEVGAKQSQLKAAMAALAAAKAAKSAPSKIPASDEPGTEAATPTPRPSAPDTTTEIKAVSEARSALATASSRAAALHREAAKQQSRASELRSNANDAARRAMQSLQVFENESATANPPARIAKNSTPRETSNAGGDDKITIADAARIAREVEQESDAAIADAERIREEIKSYERPVSGTRERVDAATRRLQTAQEQIWSSAGAARPNITVVGAPTGGTILSLAGMTSEVNAGEAVASIGRPDRLEVSIQDTSGAWKSLAPGARVLALVKIDGQNASASLAPASTSTDKSASTLARSASVQPVATQAAINGTPTLARVMAIAPPRKAGEPATIRIAVHNPPQNGSANKNGLSPRAFAPGMGVLFSLAKPGKHVMIRLPAASIRRDPANGKTSVAVLAPLPAADGGQSASACHVEWREVRVGTGDGMYNQILTGLAPGERVALKPDALYSFTLAYGPQATVHVEQT